MRESGYFSRLRLKSNAPLAKVSKIATAQRYGAHQALWRLFTADDERQFLFRRIMDRDWPEYYAVSARRPEDQDGLWDVETKVYAPKLGAGQRLRFALCANPIVTRKNAAAKPVRHDIVTDALHRYDDSRQRPSAAELAQQLGPEWLVKRGERYGFSVDTVRTEGYRRHRIVPARGGAAMRIATLDFEGILTVTDPQALVDTLFNGIGPAKSFGCGLLLIRRF